MFISGAALQGLCMKTETEHYRRLKGDPNDGEEMAERFLLVAVHVLVESPEFAFVVVISGESR